MTVHMPNRGREEKQENGRPEEKSRVREFCSKFVDNIDFYVTQPGKVTLVAMAIALTVFAYKCGDGAAPSVETTPDTFNPIADVGERRDSGKDAGKDANHTDVSDEDVAKPDVGPTDTGAEVETPDGGKDIGPVTDGGDTVDQDVGPNQDVGPQTDGGDVGPQTDGGDTVVPDGGNPICIDQKGPLPGDVDPLIQNTKTGTANFTASDAQASVDTTYVIGGKISSSSLYMLGACPNDAQSVAAFGAKGGQVGVEAQDRLDIGKTTFSAQFPASASDVCGPYSVDSDVISSYGHGGAVDTKQVAKNVKVGTTDSRGAFYLMGNLLAPWINVDGTTATSPIALSGAGYMVTTIFTMPGFFSPDKLAVKGIVSDVLGLETISRDLSSTVGTTSSKVLRVYQLGNSDSMLPTVNWTMPTANGPFSRVLACLRCTNSQPGQINIEIPGDVVAQVTDTCGKMFAGFEAKIDVVQFGAEPPHLAPYYSAIAGTSSTVAGMSDDKTFARFTLNRNRNGKRDAGELVMIDVTIMGELASSGVNPLTGTADKKFFQFTINYIDPDQSEYWTDCGCVPDITM